MSTHKTDQPTDSERFAEVDRKLAEQAAEIERLRAADPVKKAEARLMRDPVPSGYMREMLARQDAARLARVRAAEAAAEQEALEARVHAPEIAKHQRKLAEIDARIVEMCDTFERADRELAELQRERFRVAAEAPVFTKPFTARPIAPVGHDDKVRGRWRV
jgi:NifB/MoaA-like Fe-S oxidoreductase